MFRFGERKACGICCAEGRAAVDHNPSRQGWFARIHSCPRFRDALGARLLSLAPGNGEAREHPHHADGEQNDTVVRAGLHSTYSLTGISSTWLGCMSKVGETVLIVTVGTLMVKVTEP